jgi:hypothetical protein
MGGEKSLRDPQELGIEIGKSISLHYGYSVAGLCSVPLLGVWNGSMRHWGRIIAFCGAARMSVAADFQVCRAIWHHFAVCF